MSRDRAKGIFSFVVSLLVQLAVLGAGGAALPYVAIKQTCAKSGCSYFLRFCVGRRRVEKKVELTRGSPMT